MKQISMACPDKSTKERIDLADYMAQVIAQLERDGRLPAKHAYTATLNSFTDFAGGKGTPMPVGDVFTPDRLKRYETWLRDRGRAWNTVSTYLRTLKAVYNRLYPPGKPGRDPQLFQGVYTQVEAKTKRALAQDHMQTLMQNALGVLSPPDSGRQSPVHREIPAALRRPLAYFALMFLLRGMPFIDLAYLRKSDVQGNRLVYRRHKTGRLMTVQLTREAAKFLRAYRDRNPASPYLFPVLDAALTDEAELYRDYLRCLRRFNADLGELAAWLFPAGVKISSYTARHTWATLMFHMGVPVGIICEAMGHSSIRVTETYLKPFGDEKVDRANRKLIGNIMRGKERNLAAAAVG